MQFISGNIYHVYNQGNNKQIIFRDEDDYLCFLNLTQNLIFPNCDIIAYCLMPNHFHFIIYADDRSKEIHQQGGINIDALTNSFRKLLSGYARIFNKKYNQSGSVFRQKTKSKCLTNPNVKLSSALDCKDYLLTCFHYVHQNPLKASLAEKLDDWDFSSFKDYAGTRKGTLINKKIAEDFGIFNSKNFVKESYEILNDDLLKMVSFEK